MSRLISVFCGGLLVFGLGVSASQADSPRRIVSVGGSVTEILYALGKGDQIVAVDTTSIYPAAAKSKPKLGYLRALAVEPIVAMNPTLVIADGDAGPPPVLKQLREAGIKLVLAPKEPTVENIYLKMTAVSVAVNEAIAGAKMIRDLKAELRNLKKALAGLTDRPRVLFLLSIGRGSPLAGGSETSADTIIALAGGTNAAAGFTKYKPIPPEAIVAARPDVVLVTNRSLGLLGGRENLLARPEIAATPAGKAGRLVSMNGLLMLGFGPRTGEAARLLAQKLHPDLSIAEAVK